MTKTYDPNVDYMKKMEEAAANGDYEQAAYYEEKRNEKIKGEGLSQYSLSHKYEAYLPVTTEKKMEEIFKKIESRQPFSYDPAKDKLYAKYKEQYSKAGSLAREDGMAQAATLTGGYGNSYGATLGQLAYEGEMEALNDLIPQLYDRARSVYDQEGEALLDQYETLAKELEKEREDSLAKEKLEYSKQQDAADRLEAQAAAEAKALKEEQDRAYDLALSMLKSGLMPSEDILGKSGISKEDASALYHANGTESSGGGSGGGSGSGSGGGSSGGSGSGSKTGSTSGSQSGSSTAKTKDLTNTLWEKLRDYYREGQNAGDLQDFYNLHSMLRAQGYNLQPFDVWARQTYGQDYTSGKEKTVNWQSVLDLGYGPIGEDRLRQLLDAGIIEQYTRGDFIYYKKAKTPPALPTGYNT